MKSSPLSPRRRRRGLLLAVVMPATTALVLVPLRGGLNLTSDMLLFVVVTVVVAMVGGAGPALLSAAWSSALLNFYFTPPLHTLAIEDATNVLALGVYVAVAVLVSSVVDLAARRARAAAHADELAAGNRMRTALLAAVGHDFRGPLAAAKASVSSLRSHDVELERHDRDELLAAAEESLDRLASLVENLLDLSRLRAGALALHLDPTALDEVVARACDHVDPGLPDLVFDLPADIPPVLADAGLLERVLANLLQNAVRYSPMGRPPRIVAGAAPSSGQVEVRVVDHGPGIPAPRREQVFLPFQRLGDTDSSSGLGLGLALARGLTEAMGGTLEVEDTDGGGVTMVLRLAAAVVAAPEPGLRERSAGAP